MSADPRDVVRRYFELLDGNREHPVSMCTDDFRFHPYGFDEMDLATAASFAKIFFEGIPDLMHPLEEVIAEGDTVAFRCRYEGTHTEEIMGAAPTGNKISYHGIGFMRVRDGKVSEFIVSPDRMTFMQQLGVLPPTAG
jgi:predicted ester cyclase